MIAVGVGNLQLPQTLPWCVIYAGHCAGKTEVRETMLGAWPQEVERTEKGRVT